MNQVSLFYFLSVFFKYQLLFPREKKSSFQKPEKIDKVTLTLK